MTQTDAHVDPVRAAIERGVRSGFSHWTDLDPNERTVDQLVADVVHCVTRDLKARTMQAATAGGAVSEPDQAVATLGYHGRLLLKLLEAKKLPSNTENWPLLAAMARFRAALEPATATAQEGAAVGGLMLGQLQEMADQGKGDTPLVFDGYDVRPAWPGEVQPTPAPEPGSVEGLVELLRYRGQRWAAGQRGGELDNEAADTLTTLQQQIAARDAELSAVSAAIGSVRFMDPPDGGDVSLGEQVRRMAAALTAAEAECAKLKGLLDVALETLDNYAAPEGYTDDTGEEYGPGDDAHPGLLAKETAANLRAALAAKSAGGGE